MRYFIPKRWDTYWLLVLPHIMSMQYCELDVTIRHFFIWRNMLQFACVIVENKSDGGEEMLIPVPFLVSI
jgi:hypothetical protein